MSKLALVLLALIAGVSAFMMDTVSAPSVTLKLMTLEGFPYEVTPSFGEDKARALLNLINTAASLYRDDLEKNIKYIQTNMDIAFAEPG